MITIHAATVTIDSLVIMSDLSKRETEPNFITEANVFGALPHISKAIFCRK